MLKIDENVDIKKYSTLKIGGQFRYFIYINNKEDLAEAYRFAESKKLPVFVLGGGSNMVFPDGLLERVALKINILGFDILEETNDFAIIKIGAGEIWDSIVEKVVSMHLSGIEAMSAIPGTVGATPVQNVGAYGQEIKDTLLEVEVFDIDNFSFKTLSNTDCQFSYRDSTFKRHAKGRYVIVSVSLKLSKNMPDIPNYPGVKKYFIENSINNPSITEIREAIISIRQNKLPDPKEIPSVGSFFKNPIIDKDTAHNLKQNYNELTLFPVGDDRIKISAGWLIDQAGLKDKNFGKISTYQHNALVLVNNGGATRADVEQTRDEIIKTVFDKFNITLETEPEFV